MWGGFGRFWWVLKKFWEGFRGVLGRCLGGQGLGTPFVKLLWVLGKPTSLAVGDTPKPYKFIGFGDIYGPKPYKCIGFGDIYGPKPYKFIGFGWAPELAISQSIQKCGRRYPLLFSSAARSLFLGRSIGPCEKKWFL